MLTKIIFLVIAIAVLILLIHTILALKFIYKLNHPTINKFQLYSKVSVTFKKFDAFTLDGLLIKGIEYKPKVQPRATIIVCHYLGGTKFTVLIYIDFLIKAGYRVLCFDFRNHGESEHTKGIRISLTDDFDAFYSAVRKLGIGHTVGIIGFSMGATPALIALNKYPEIKAAVIDSGPLLLVKNYFKYLLDHKKVTNFLTRFLILNLYLYFVGFIPMSEETMYNLKKLKEKKDKKIFFIHGLKDKTIPNENSKYALKLLGSGVAEYWEVPGSRHLSSRFIREEEYIKKVLGFFSKNLSDD